MREFAKPCGKMVNGPKWCSQVCATALLMSTHMSLNDRIFWAPEGAIHKESFLSCWGSDFATVSNKAAESKYDKLWTSGSALRYKLNLSTRCSLDPDGFFNDFLRCPHAYSVIYLSWPNRFHRNGVYFGRQSEMGMGSKYILDIFYQNIKFDSKIFGAGQIEEFKFFEWRLKGWDLWVIGYGFDW